MIEETTKSARAYNIMASLFEKARADGVDAAMRFAKTEYGYADRDGRESLRNLLQRTAL